MTTKKSVPVAAKKTRPSKRSAVKKAAKQPTLQSTFEPPASPAEIPERTSPDVSVTVYAGVFVAAVVVLGCTSWLALGSDRPSGWEHDWLWAINAGLPARLSGLMQAVTLLGSLWAAVVGVVGVFFAQMYHLAWRLALATLTTYGLAMLMKNLIERPRPIGPLDDIYVRVTESGFSFPSGHAALVTATTLTLVVCLPRKWWWTAIVPIALVALSRLYLGVHAPLDVVGGVALGAAVVAFLRILPGVVRRGLRIE